MKTLLVLTGPQGSGNHLWSKIFALHPEVYGWVELLDQYWIGHDQEPFAEYWKDPNRLHDFDWIKSDYFVTSISVPYALNGTLTIPDLLSFQQAAEKLNVAVRFAIIGRDRNIVGMQEQRVRGCVTLNHALEQFQKINPTIFLSYELLHLYQQDYLKNISQQLNFPVAYMDPRIKEIIQEDTNTKYFKPVEYHPTDDLAKHASRKWK